MPPGLILYCRIRNLKSGLRPETIGADKDFKDLRAFKDFSDGWGPGRVGEGFYGGRIW